MKTKCICYCVSCCALCQNASCQFCPLFLLVFSFFPSATGCLPYLPVCLAAWVISWLICCLLASCCLLLVVVACRVLHAAPSDSAMYSKARLSSIFHSALVQVASLRSCKIQMAVKRVVWLQAARGAQKQPHTQEQEQEQRQFGYCQPLPRSSSSSSPMPMPGPRPTSPAGSCPTAPSGTP